MIVKVLGRFRPVNSRSFVVCMGILVWMSLSGNILLGTVGETSETDAADETYEYVGSDNEDAESGEGSALAANVNLVAAHSRKCLDVAGRSTAGGATIIQKSCATSNDPQLSQQWSVTPVGDNRFNIVNRNSGLCLDVGGSSQADGALVYQSACRGPTKSNQVWTMRRISGDWYSFVAVHSGKCLDVFTRSQQDGTSVIQWTCSAGTNQQWAQVSAEQAAPPWGKVGGVVTTEVLFTTPPYSGQSTSAARIDLMSANELSPLTHYNGSTYFVWTDTKRRTHLTKIKNGVVETQPLDASPDYVRACNGHGRFSLGVDRAGYLHVVGDMHNYTDGTLNGDESNYPTRYQKQAMLYWRSKNPESVSGGFEFVGGKGSATAMPGTGWTYGRFFTDNNGVLYHSSRVKAINGSHEPGEIGLGVYRYDTATRVWTALGTTPPKIRTGTYWKVVLWEQSGFAGVFTGAWFQGIMPTLKFDHENRLHVASSINTNTKFPGNDRIVYAAATDADASAWARADGTQLQGALIRGVGGLASSGDRVAENISNPNFGLFTAVLVDKEGTPGVMQDHVWRYWDGGKWVIDSNIPWSGAGLMASNQSMIMTDESSAKIHVQPTFGEPVVSYQVSNTKRLYAVDEYALRREGVIYAVGIDADAMTQRVLKISIK